VRCTAGILRGAALDVYPEEPLPADKPSALCPGLTLTPHLAGATEEVSGRMYDIALQALNDLYHRTDWTGVASGTGRSRGLDSRSRIWQGPQVPNQQAGGQ